MPPRTNGIVFIHISRCRAAQVLFYQQNHTDHVSELFRDPAGCSYATSTQGALNLFEEKGGTHRLWLNGLELQGLNTYKTRDLLATALVYIWDEGANAAPDDATPKKTYITPPSKP
jgi:hypothetical protein